MFSSDMGFCEQPLVELLDARMFACGCPPPQGPVLFQVEANILSESRDLPPPPAVLESGGRFFCTYAFFACAIRLV